jgi:hypothetical protein
LTITIPLKVLINEGDGRQEEKKGRIGEEEKRRPGD